MPDISSIGPTGNTPVGPIDRPGALADRRDDPPVRSAPPARPGDRVELSTHARFLDRIRDLPEGRHDRVDEVRNAIREGTYVTDEKLDIALGRLLDDIG
ncbi:MAG: flagellar biosynthesis anti-sigma factor FlgM [Planctomycetota bacterium]|jgi:anti-sigma28 factor (negative regulator of flagellin synthesis)